MASQLSFDIAQHFRTTESGIAIPCLLDYNGRIKNVEAKVDTGSEFNLFTREIAEDLGIEVETGYAINLNILTGRLTAFAHVVTIETLAIRFEALVLFHSGYGTKRNLLGRVGWLNNLHMALTMDDEMIYLKHIGDEAL